MKIHIAYLPAPACCAQDGCSACGDPDTMQLRQVTDSEERYWRANFMRQSYYVPGRSYGQYQPAFALGYQCALRHPEARFEQLSACLEHQWARNATSSLLPWHEVHDAVHAAWQHALMQRTASEADTPAPLLPPQTARQIHTLACCYTRLANTLQQCTPAPGDTFISEAITHHAQQLRAISRALIRLSRMPARPQPVYCPWTRKLHNQWMSVWADWIDTSPARLLHRCEKQEHKLLATCHQIACRPLPKHIRRSLQIQEQLLHAQIGKLQLVRSLLHA